MNEVKSVIQQGKAEQNYTYLKNEIINNFFYVHGQMILAKIK